MVSGRGGLAVLRNYFIIYAESTLRTGPGGETRLGKGNYYRILLGELI